MNDKKGDLGLLLRSNSVQRLCGDDPSPLKDEAMRRWNWAYTLVLPDAHRHEDHAHAFLQSHPQFDNNNATRKYHGEVCDVGHYGPNTPKAQNDARKVYRKEWCKPTYALDGTGDYSHGWSQF